MEDKFNDLIERAKKFNKKTICFPEGEEKRVAGAVEMLVKNDSCKVVLLGNKNKIENIICMINAIKLISLNNLASLGAKPSITIVLIAPLEIKENTINAT